MKRWRLWIVNIVLLLTLMGSSWGRRVDDAVVSSNDFLSALNMPYRGWKINDEKLSASELEVLKPDATLVRRYNSPDGDMAELAVIAGHRKQSVHTPGFCMVGGGWEMLEQRDDVLALPERKVDIIRTIMRNDKQQALVVLYFFTDGDYCTRNIVQFQGHQILSRLRSQVPIGALVRLMVPVRKDTADAQQLAEDFARATVPAVLANLRGVHLITR